MRVEGVELAAHAVEAVDGTGPVEVWDVVGPLCESGDVLARGATLAGVDVDTLLVVRDVGAYSFVMSSEYNAHPRPAQVWIEDDRWVTITPRRSFDEMLQGEQLAPWQQLALTDDDC